MDAGSVDPVIGRDIEIDRLICILYRRTKNFAALVGAAGVGKTAIVEGLARRIAAGTVPDLLIGARVAVLDVGAMIAGTTLRGMFEQRLKEAIKQAEDEGGKLILFIDEMHMLIGMLVDGKGRDVDFKNTIIIMSSNLGSGHLSAEVAGKHFMPDLINRLSEIAIFEPLSCNELRKIVMIQMKSIIAMMANKCVSLTVANAALEVILSETHDVVHGVRPIKM
ncbi:chaperone protein ClpB1 [Hordeum vulgare]|nr:chaperone protein ClpB1 [Hordeum vulgare]